MTTLLRSPCRLEKSTPPTFYSASNWFVVNFCFLEEYEFTDGINVISTGCSDEGYFLWNVQWNWTKHNIILGDLILDPRCFLLGTRSLKLEPLCNYVLRCRKVPPQKCLMGTTKLHIFSTAVKFVLIFTSSVKSLRSENILPNLFKMF